MAFLLYLSVLVILTGAEKRVKLSGVNQGKGGGERSLSSRKTSKGLDTTPMQVDTRRC